jgi:imidazolonepropionase
MKKGCLIIKNASELVTCSGFSAKHGKEMSDLHVINDGAVVIEKGVITAVGKTRDILSRFKKDNFDVVDACERTVLPGFIDPHTHFVFGGDRAQELQWRLRGDSYMEIMGKGGGIVNTVKATRNASKEELVESGKKRLDSMLSFGVTTVEGKSGYGLDRDTEIKQLEAMIELDKIHPVDVVRTYLGAHVVPTEFHGRGDEYIDFIIEDVLPEVSERGLAEFCDIFCEENVFSLVQSTKLLEKAKTMGMGLKIHADEIVPLGGAELAARVEAVSADHLLQASDRGIKAMVQSGVIATLLPGTAFSLKEDYARARFMIDSGLSVALATDQNPGTFYSESIALIFALAALYMNMSTEETLTALTINAAAALGRAQIIGSIDKGKKGDLVVLEAPSYTYLPYRTGINTVEKVIKNGMLVYVKNI